VTEERATEAGMHPTVLAVDDQPPNLRLLDAVLSPRGYQVLTAGSGQEALDVLQERSVDLVLLDVQMPGMDGCEVCRRIRSDPRTEFLPVIMITAGAAAPRLEGLEAGADDFLTKPFDQAELLARVRSLARLKSYHDTMRRQADEIAAWNRELEDRVASQVFELERVGRLRRFLSPQLADLVVNDEGLLASHRREIVVVFCDFRGFTLFAEASEPEEVMHVLGEFHQALGARIDEHRGTLERFTGDGVMVFFGDPVEDPEPARSAVAMALAVRDDVRSLAGGWARRGHDLGLGIGIAQGYATLGRIGYPGRSDYAAIGSVTNLAARLCADAAAWQVLVTDRVLAQVEERVAAELVGDVQPKGFSRPVRVHDVLAETTGG
jgi:class 3 adenylate cyclase/CheY-like chemotaxis protein